LITGQQVFEQGHWPKAEKRWPISLEKSLGQAVDKKS
jgi:hypothetical protein